jgi:hypothetical protein
MMRKLLLALMLLSPFSFADWGDVYYCQMTSSVGIDSHGTITKYKLERFKFKLDDREMGAVLIKGSRLGGVYVPVERDGWRPEVPEWEASDSHSKITFKEGKLMYTDNFITSGASLISAKCEKF